MSIKTQGLLLTLLLLSGCTVQHTIEETQRIRGEVGLGYHATVERQRQFTLPIHSRLAISYKPTQDQLVENFALVGSVGDQLKPLFASVDVLEKPQSLRSAFKQARDIDSHFLIVAELLSKDMEEERQADIERQFFYREAYMDFATVKLTLYDCHSGRLLDFAIVKARSGWLPVMPARSPYPEFLKIALSRYGEQLSTAQQVY